MDRNGYIGRAPADSSVVVARQVFSPSGVTTDFSFTSGYEPGYLDLYLNGIRLVEGTDYVATSSPTITVLNGGSTGGDVLEAVAYKAFNATTSNRIGVTSAGSLIGNVDTLNFIGVGNTFLLNGTQVDISISGSAGAGGTWANYDGVNGITTSKKVRIQNNLDVTGNISVGGTLTYEDVTNVDSVGVITARSGVHVTGGSIGIGTDNPNQELHIHASGTSYVQFTDEASGTGSTNGAVFGLDDPHLYAWNYQAGDFVVATNATEKFRVTSAGLIDVSGGIQVSENVTPTTGSGLEIFKASSTVGQVQAFDRDGASWMDLRLKGNQFEVFAAGSERLRIASSGQIGLGGANYGTAGQVITSNGSGSAPTWQDAGGAGFTTEAFVKTTGQTATLNIGSAVDHKVTCTGTVTIDAVGGTAASNEGESHTIRIINNGTATVGFSTYYLFPSGAAPSLPTADGAISLISFTVNRVGAGGTQLLAGVSVNYS